MMQFPFIFTIAPIAIPTSVPAMATSTEHDQTREHVSASSSSLSSRIRNTRSTNWLLQRNFQNSPQRNVSTDTSAIVSSIKELHNLSIAEQKKALEAVKIHVNGLISEHSQEEIGTVLTQLSEILSWENALHPQVHDKALRIILRVMTPASINANMIRRTFHLHPAIQENPALSNELISNTDRAAIIGNLILAWPQFSTNKQETVLPLILGQLSPDTILARHHREQILMFVAGFLLPDEIEQGFRDVGFEGFFPSSLKTLRILKDIMPRLMDIPPPPDDVTRTPYQEIIPEHIKHELFPLIEKNLHLLNENLEPSKTKYLRSENIDLIQNTVRKLNQFVSEYQLDQYERPPAYDA